MTSQGTILYVGHFELPDKNAAAHRVVNNAKILNDLGYRVVLVGIDKSPNRTESGLKSLVCCNFDAFSVPYPRSKSSWFRHMIGFKDIRQALKRYDDVKAVIFYNYSSVVMWRGLRYCRRRNIKVVADCTEWYSDRRSFPMNLFVGLDVFLRVNIIQKKLDGLILISRYLERYYNGVKNKILAPPLIDPLDTKWRVERLSYDSSKINFVYSGVMGKKDRIDQIIETFAQIHEKSNSWLFRVVGMTSEEYLTVYPEHRKILQSFPNIVFYGRLSHCDSIKILKSSDFLVFPRDRKRSTLAGFPTKFVESWTCGVPVITTNTSDLDEYITDGINGFFLDNDTVKWNEKIRKILSLSREEMTEMKKNMEKEAKLFDYRCYVDAFRKFLNNL